MHRIDSLSAAQTKPTPKPAGVPGFFSSGPIPTGLSPDWANTIQEEIANVVIGSDIALNKLDDTQLLAAIRKIVDDKIAAIPGVEVPEPSAPVDPLNYVPMRSIVMWDGGQGTIPAGWVMCDGQNGTPDLRDRFIVGYGSLYGVGANGGSNYVTPTIHGGGATAPGLTDGTALTAAMLPPHSHTFTTGSGEATIGGNGPANAQNAGPVQIVTTSDTGNGDTHNHAIPGLDEHSHGVDQIDNRPPYYALAYIMRIF